MVTTADKRAILAVLRSAWPARLPHQTPPSADWTGWLLLGGRGAGKSEAITLLLRDEVRRTPDLRARIIGPTLDDVVASDVYGPAGILALDPECRFVPSSPGGASLQWPSGAECRLIGTPTARDVDRLRASGNRELDLFEELAANPHQQDVFDQARLGRRLGRPRWAAATTPKFTRLIRSLVEDEAVTVTRATSSDNPHLPEAFLTDLEAQYAGSRLYRQEVLGELVEDVEGALWTFENLDRSRVAEAPELGRIAVGVDPATGTGTTGIVVVALGLDGHLYVLDDMSKRDASPEQWGSAVAEIARMRGGTVVAEDNQGGQMVASVLKAAGVDMPVKLATARASKKARAEPVAVEWERTPPTGHLVGSLPLLEDELTSWVPGEKSPDRLDAMVWATTWLRQSASVKVKPLVSIDVT